MREFKTYEQSLHGEKRYAKSQLANPQHLSLNLPFLEIA